MSKRQIITTIDECKPCGHRWLRRRPKAAKVCPKCKRTNWHDAGYVKAGSKESR